MENPKITITYEGQKKSCVIDSYILEKAKRKNSRHRKIISCCLIDLWEELKSNSIAEILK
jgi:hypothetical protein